MINKAIDIVIKAGKIMLNPPEFKVFEKDGHGNFVTQIDEQVQEYLIKELKEISKSTKIIAEEQENKKMDEGEYFIIDPIDGTLNFIRGRGESAISLAYMKNKEPLWAVVYNPFNQQLYATKKDEGAFLNKKQIHVSKVEFSSALTLFGTAPYQEELLLKTMYYAYRFKQETVDIRRVGSAALDICDVAAGRSDVFFEATLSPWDYAAGALILREAGGMISQMDGTAIDFDKDCSILATNKKCYERALEILKEKPDFK